MTKFLRRSLCTLSTRWPCSTSSPQCSSSGFLYGSPLSVSVTSRLGLRRTWNPSAVKSSLSEWRFHSTQISSNKPTTQSASSNSAKEPVTSPRVWSDTQGKRILWVNVADKIEYGVGEVVHYSPKVASTKKGRQTDKIWKMMDKIR